MIKQMTKLGENFFPKTTTAAVVDETSGKTLEAMLPLLVDLSGAVSQELYDALDQAIDSGKQIVVTAGPGFSAMPAVGMRNTDGEGVVLMIQVQTLQGVTAVAFYVNPETSADPNEVMQWRMVKAGQGVEITDDGTLNCTLDTSPFIIPPDGVLPETGEEGKIYLIPATSTGDQNVMLEYVWVNEAWEKFGEFKTEVDLSQYAKMTYVDDAINNAMAVARTLSESTELSPKTYNALGTLAADTVLTMNAGRHTVPEYQGEFSFGDTVYAVTFPEEVIWNVTPAYLPNKRYQFSILNGLGVMCEFPLSNETSE